ncbi:MAG: WYL domain-containing protein [Tyzzerella sp.]|nr:WYL domain-containing protein [Tyzzerella sp.]
MSEMELGKNDRVLTIYTKLMNGQVVKKADMAQQFGVNVKSIQRDLDNIKNFLGNQTAGEGIPNQLIYDYKLKGYRLEQSNKVKLTNDEILAVSKILLDSRAFTKPEMMNILDKLLESCVPKKNQKLVNDLISNERFHYIEPNHHKVYMDKMMVLGQAIRECKVITIKYQRLKDKALVERRIQPLAIMFSEYYFYLVGFIEGIDKSKEFDNANDPFPTIYRIDRIESLKVLDEHFKIPYSDRFEEGEFRKRIQFMYGGRLKKVRFKYTGLSVEAILDRLPTAKILSEENGEYIISAEVFGDGIDMWLRSQGDAVKVM